MTDVSYVLVKQLRERTGVGIMECKKALVQSHGDIELAIDHMRKSGKAKAAKKAGRVAAEGIILIKMTQNGKYGVIIELNCETDFVVKNECFKAFGEQIITSALTERISNIDVLKATFEDKRTLLVDKIGENINISRLGILEGDLLASYLHCTQRIGVVVSAIGINKKILKHVAMHIVASKPEYVNADDIPSAIILREYQIQREIVMKYSKPIEIAEKIVESRIKKYVNELTLIGQHFVMDPSKTIGHLLNEHRMKVNSFIRFEVGESINQV